MVLQEGSKVLVWLQVGAVEVSWLQAEQQGVSSDSSTVPASGGDSG